MNRRDFLKTLALFTGVSCFPFVFGQTRGWAGRVDSLGSLNSSNKRLIVLMLRGAVDGLNVVVPYGETAYYQNRKTIAIPPPGGALGALDLNGFFGLTPSLKALKPLWDDKSLAFVHASGSTDVTRSHFEAQDFIERGLPSEARLETGWMNRLLAILQGNSNPIQAISFSRRITPILTGNVSVANFPLSQQVGKSLPIDKPELMKAFDSLYQGNPKLGAMYQEGRLARDTILSDFQSEGFHQAMAQDQNALEMIRANNGAPLSTGFARDVVNVGLLLRKDPRIQLAFLELGGWDTHVGQGGVTGQLANRLQPVGEGLAALARSLGESYQETVIAVISEFGRTVGENGDGGTDHGHGNVMWLLGGPIKGGKVYGTWPGLETEQLYEKRDLAVTTDFRTILSKILVEQFHLSPAQLSQVFPKFTPVLSQVSGLI
ncbi:MAG: DUF1501 domain-containing protein [Cyanobacteria bacterium]|nr:DUF1501 domain-containing protein [Cyanobacteriota bacterium]